MGAKSKAVMGAVDALGNKIGALGDYLKEFDPRTFYHYSDNPDIKKFDPEAESNIFKSGGGGGSDYGERGATYFTSDSEFANELGESIKKSARSSPTIYPVRIKTKDIFDFENPEHLKRLSDEPDEIGDDILEGSYLTFEDEEIQEVLKEAGFRGYRTNEPGTVGLFYSDKGDVRSIFAKFDPSKSKKGEILASVPVAGALGALGAVDGTSSD
jgi:hypothetical protein